MDNPHNPSRVQVYLKAKTEDELIEKQFLNNVENGKSYNYHPPMKDGKFWYVWYYADITSDKRLDHGNSTKP